MTSSLSVACHSLISIQCLARWSHYLRWMYQTRGLLLWGSFSSDSNAGLGLASDWLFRGQTYLEVSERHSSSKYLPLCFPLALSTQFLIWRAQTTIKLSAPSEDTGLSLNLSYEISSSSGEARSHCPFACGGLSAAVHTCSAREHSAGPCSALL